MMVRSRLTRAGFAALALFVLCCVPARARAIEFEPDSLKFEVLDKAGEPETRAGAHPDRVIQRFEFAPTEPREDAREAVIDLPAGMSGNLDAVPYCPRWVLGEFPFDEEPCPEDSRIGTFLYTAENASFPLFNVEPAPNELAVFGTNIYFLPLKFVAALRPGDQGLSLHLSEIPQRIFSGGQIELWGVPADHQEGTEIPRRALLTNPTRCDGGSLAVGLHVRSWQHPDTWTSAVADSGEAPTDCGGLGFQPTVDFSLDDDHADTPAGAEIEVRVPQDEAPEGRATSMVKGLSLTLPVGLTVSPGGAAAIVSCSDAQLGLGQDSDPTCPAASRVGSVELDPAAGGRPLSGAIYLGEEHPGDRFRVFVAASAPGIQVKFTGSLNVDPRTGRIAIDLDDLPQAAFDRLRLSFDGGPRALLATPLECGAAPVAATFTPYSGGSPVDWAGSVNVAPTAGGACGPSGFAPGFEAGSEDAHAGDATSFTIAVRRRDGEQLPAGMTVALPAGVSAALGTVDTCDGAAVATGDCPAGSRIGSAAAELGPGGHPARIDGDAFLTGPYRGSRFGVALVFDVALGPYDLGKLVVRGAVRVDIDSGQVAVEIPSLPEVFEGIPIRFQAIRFDLDRPGFMFNPTSCAPAGVVASLRSQSGATATATAPFRMRGCIDLPFQPRLSVALGPKSQLHAGGRPGLRMSMRIARHSANLRSVAVRLPDALGFAASGLEELCARRRAMEGRCPRGASVGTAFARTPLLDRPMTGLLYLVQPRGGGLPDIWAALSGQGLQANLRATTEVRKGRAVTRFLDLPDFPLSSLLLRMRPGDGGALKLKRRPCGRLVAPAEIGGQNGAILALRAKVRTQSACSPHG